MKSSTNKFLTIAVVLLLLANIALVAFMMMGKNSKPSGKDGGREGFEKIVKELQLTDVQKKQYDSLRDNHFKIIRPLFDSMRVQRQSMFSLIKNDNINDSLVNLYTSNISEKQMLADKQTIHHFRQLRSILTPIQQQKFDDFVQKMMQRSRKDSTSKK